MANRDKKSRKMRLTDFVLRFSPGRPRQQTPEEMLTVLQAFAGKANGDDS